MMLEKAHCRLRIGSHACTVSSPPIAGTVTQVFPIKIVPEHLPFCSRDGNMVRYGEGNF